MDPVCVHVCVRVCLPWPLLRYQMKVVNMLPQQGAKRVKVVEVLYAYTHQHAQHRHARARTNTHIPAHTAQKENRGHLLHSFTSYPAES